MRRTGRLTGPGSLLLAGDGGTALGMGVGETRADAEVGRYRLMARDTGEVEWRVRRVCQATGPHPMLPRRRGQVERCTGD